MKNSYCVGGKAISYGYQIHNLKPSLTSNAIRKCLRTTSDLLEVDGIRFFDDILGTYVPLEVETSEKNEGSTAKHDLADRLRTAKLIHLRSAIPRTSATSESHCSEKAHTKEPF